MADVAPTTAPAAPASRPPAAPKRPAVSVPMAPKPRPEGRFTAAAGGVGDRIQISLSYPAAIISGVSVLLALIVIFKAGQVYGGSKPTQAPRQLEVVPPDVEEGAAPALDLGTALDAREGASSVPERASGESKASPAPAQAPPKLELRPGYHYVVVQHFPSRKLRDAQMAATFLRARGVECGLLRSADIQLLCAQPFAIDVEDAAVRRAAQREADALVNRVKELGRDYFKEAGYDFAGVALREIK